jgi:hypothetical protein
MAFITLVDRLLFPGGVHKTGYPGKESICKVTLKVKLFQTRFFQATSKSAQLLNESRLDN